MSATTDECACQWGESHKATCEVARERAMFGVARSDSWNLDVYLARVIAKGVHDLRFAGPNGPHGSPASLKDGEWEAILGEIEDGFSAYVKAEGINDVPGFDRAFDLLCKWWGALWD